MTGAGEPGCLHLPGKSPSLTVCLLCRSLSAQSCYLSLSEVDTLFCIAVLLLVFHTLLETNRHFTLKVVSSVEWEWRNWLQFFIPEYRLCHQSSACLNPWAVSWVCLVFVFCSAFALWLFSCTCFVRQYFPAHDSLDNIFLHMIHWTIFSCTWFIGQYFPAHAVLDNIFLHMIHWTFSCTWFIGQYFPAHDSLDNIFLHMIHWTIFSCMRFIGQYFPARAVSDNIFLHMIHWAIFSCTWFIGQYFPAPDSLDNIFLHMIHWTIFSCTCCVRQYFFLHEV